ncbi:MULTISPECIES: DUF427 domain-containing protein [Sphingomonas]|jgi:uncharacterized protein (DUF427 family)|uniref:DUF427 domain-containing protein n=1 Tax=Sphingomonas parapaucimobilis NBRC 15100 TaxID=1219049 RepID=A0A0A1WA10_9SPHN|nr:MULTISPECIES: DUF427 domain-containing protein [Sphingomonas]OMJ32499.1 hypothetical protein BSZ14_07885 [Sphingomonas sp. Sph1(2015)]GAM01796.1 hypothetical protein SP5_069_00400 [Sphingomonas parapaucimobilis NBRC 15100]
MTKPQSDPVGPGQESVWTYPRPAIAEPSPRHVRIAHRGIVIADTRAAVRTLETSHPPSWYLPPADINQGVLRRSDRRSFCEWKGEAIYWHVTLGETVLRDVAWSYPNPMPGFAILRDHLAFYAGPFDHCTVDGEQVRPQPGGFYGGWITADLAGPFKGVPGSMGW